MNTWSTPIMKEVARSAMLGRLCDMLKLLPAEHEIPWDQDRECARTIIEQTGSAHFLDVIEHSDDTAMMAQVVAYMHIAVGAPMSDELKMLAIIACREEDVSRHTDPVAYRDCLDKFIDDIRRHHPLPH